MCDGYAHDLPISIPVRHAHLDEAVQLSGTRLVSQATPRPSGSEKPTYLIGKIGWDWLCVHWHDAHWLPSSGLASELQWTVRLVGSSSAPHHCIVKKRS